MQRQGIALNDPLGSSRQDGLTLMKMMYPKPLVDVIEANDVFIDQVEPSQEWTSWRDNLATQMFAEYV
ncbi:hypothetical protein ACS0TY_020311 [Phlomoides rotata]